MVGTAAPDVDELWAHLAEPAALLGVGMPSPAELAGVLDAFAVARGPVAAITAVTLSVVAGESRFVVTASNSRGYSSVPVRIDRCDVDAPLTVPEDPHWRRMAARTTSRADRDQLARWLAGRGCADAVSTRGAPVPFLGALVFECGAGDSAGFVGLENPEPTSVLTQLTQCGVVRGVRRVTDAPVGTGRVWWFSPAFALSPVSAIGGTSYQVSEDVPAFVRSA